jgi:glycerol kinase
MHRYIVALDQGTTSSRSIIFDEQGSSIAIAQREFRQIFPKPGWVEHDPEEIWESQYWTIQEALRIAKLTPKDIAAIGIVNQRETTILWDRRTGRAVTPAIVWQDRRTTDICATFKARGIEPTVSSKTGLLLDPYFSATKVAWMLAHVPTARARADRGELCFGTVDSWLIWKLTQGGHHVTDRTNASRTLLMNLQRSQWDEELLDIFGIPHSCLPLIIDSCGPPDVKAKLDDFEIPILGVAGDQQAALFGQCCTRPGMAKNTYGTGCFMLLHTGNELPISSHRLLSTAACNTTAISRPNAQSSSYALEGSVFVGGAVIQWLRDGLGLIQDSSEIEALAASVSDNGGVYMVPAFTGLGSPHWDPAARGTVVGLTRGAERGHIARAALESIAFQSAELLQGMAADAGQPPTEIRVDGGASRNNLLMQFQADLLGLPVVRPKFTETTALGAAYLAGLGAGVWQSIDELEQLWKVDRIFEPTMSKDEATHKMSIWERAVSRAKSWAE